MMFDVFKREFRKTEIIYDGGRNEGFSVVCHWESLVTGELVPNLYEVIKTIIDDAFHFHFINLKWKYLKDGV